MTLTPRSTLRGTAGRTEHPGDRRGWLARAYTEASVALVSGFLILAVANLLLYAFPSFRPTTAMETPLNDFGVDRLLPAYPGWSAKEIVRLHTESRVVFRYEPIVEFKVKPIAGQYVNMSALGLRRTARTTPWPPDEGAFNVFFFGGSTTFGWLLPDGDTIPSQLQELVAADRCRRPVAVYNFGHPAYMSTQESLLFESLVTMGTRPQLAVFIDGFNDFFYRGQMAFTSTLRQIMDHTDLQYRLGPIADLPLFLMARKLRARLLYAPPAEDPATESQEFSRIIAQWIHNEESIHRFAEQHGIETAFVWQPVSTFKYDLRYLHLNGGVPPAPGEPVPFGEVGRGYAMMSAKWGDVEPKRRALWLADIQRDRKDNLYIDRAHYTAAFSREIAAHVLDFLKGERLIPCGDN